MNTENNKETNIIFATSKPIEMATEKVARSSDLVILKSLRPLRSVGKVKSVRPASMSRKVETTKKKVLS